MKQSLGLVEVRGMTAAITVADTMCKTANVQIHQLEKTRGGGWMLVMILGDVQAVQVAVEAGAAIAKSMNCYVGQTVIARLSDGLLDTFSPAVKELVEEVMTEEDFSETVTRESEAEISSPLEESLSQEIVSEDVSVIESLEEKTDEVEDGLVLPPVEEIAVVEAVAVEKPTSKKASKSDKKRPKKTKKAKRN